MLSDRIRPNSEAAPWVVDEVKSLEAALQVIANFPLEEFGREHEPDDRTLTAFNQWSLTIGDVRRARTLLKQSGNWCRPCGGTITEEQAKRCGFGRCPHRLPPNAKTAR